MKRFYLYAYAFFVSFVTSMWSPVVADNQFFQAIKFEELAQKALQTKQKSQDLPSIDQEKLASLKNCYAEFLKNYSQESLAHASNFFSQENCEAAKVIKFKQEMQTKAMGAMANLLSPEPELLPEHAVTQNLLKTAFEIMADLHTILKWINTSGLVKRLTPDVHTLVNDLKLDANKLQEFLNSEHGKEFVLKSCKLENEIGKIFSTWLS